MNTILNSRNALLVVNREKICSSPPRTQMLRNQTQYTSSPLSTESPKISGMAESHVMHLQGSDPDQSDSRRPSVDSGHPLGGSMIFPMEGGPHSISSETQPGGSPIAEGGSYFSHYPHQRPVIDIQGLDFDQIPDFVENGTSGERFASCPGTILLQPTASPSTMTQYPSLQHQFNYEDTNEFQYSTPGTVGLRDSLGSEQMESLSLADLSL